MGSTSVACWLVELVKRSVLRRVSSEGGGGGLLEPPLSPEFEPDPQAVKLASSRAATTQVATRAADDDTNTV